MGRWMAEGGYDRLAERLFSEIRCDRWLLEYDSERAGTFDPLKYAPKDKIIVLAPEGFYGITPGQMNPNSNYYLSINTGFPNAYDRANDRWRISHDPRRLLLARLLRHDRRADR